MNNKSIKILMFFFFLFTISVTAQVDSKVKLTGKITYQSSQNIYTGFVNTKGIKVGDTLFVVNRNKYIPAVSVKFLSSTSCAGEKITSKELKVGEDIYAFIRKDGISDKSIITDSEITKDTLNENKKYIRTDKEKYAYKKSLSEPKFYGRFSVYSNSNISNENNLVDDQRWRYTLSLKADNISGSGFSFSNYTIFTYRSADWSNITSNLGRAVRVYDLSLKYKFNNSTVTWLGRHINSKISNISSLDGIQFEKYFGSVYAGAVAGSRPNFSDMGFNSKLFEFGAYVGKTDTLGNGQMQNTFAAFEQTNNFKTDRRFIYLQHTDNIFSKVYIFASSEIDLYKVEMGQSKNDFSLTSLFLMTNYSPMSQLSLSLSYDARKNIIYYETFKNFIDSVVERETNQGIRGRINFRPINKLNIGFSGGYRFQPGDKKPSRNLSAYISYYSIPEVKIFPSFAYTKLISSYIEGQIYSVRLSRDFLNNLINFAVGFRNISYTFSGSSEILNQREINSDISFYIIKNLFLSLNYEGTFENRNTFNRIYAGITTRF